MLTPIDVVTSVGVVSYGWDQPIVSCAVQACRTLSLAKHRQQLGRVLRPWPAPAIRSGGLRPYQVEEEDQIRRALRECKDAGLPPWVLLESPTGSGKGFLIVDIIRKAVTKNPNIRVLFIVNRKELVKDESRRLDREGLDHGIIMSNHPRRNPLSRIHVASIDTLHRRPKLPPADMIFCDESHFSLAPTWLKVLANYPNVPLVGMTATPCRMDGRGLGEIYQRMVNGPTVADLIADGYLVPTRVIGPPPPPDAMKLRRTSTGDANQKRMGEIYDKPKLVGDVVEHWMKHGRYPDGRPMKTVVFATTVEHSKHILSEYLKAGISAAHVDADTPDAERDEIWHRLNLGAEGLPPKTEAIIIDHGGNWALHGWAEDEIEWSLHAPPVRKSKKDPSLSVRTCKRCWRVYASTLTKCPSCGLVPEKQERKVTAADGELEEIEPKWYACQACRHRGRYTEIIPAACPRCDCGPVVATASKYDDGDKNRHREKFLEFARIASERGYKPGFAFARFRAMYGYNADSAWLNVTGEMADLFSERAVSA